MRPAPPVAATVTWAQVAAFRVARQALDERRTGPDADPAAIASLLGGLHAQLLSSAELSVWARAEDAGNGAGAGAEDADAGNGNGNGNGGRVARALWGSRSLVKLWAMRGTLHLLPSAEYPAWQAALATYRHFLKPSWSRAFGLTPDELETLLDAIHHALDGPPLTRSDLAASVAERTGDPHLGERLRESWGAMLKPASFRGVLCFADNDGTLVRFTRPDRWLPPPDPGAEPPPTGDDAVAAALHRYLSVHGPADREHLGRWFAVSPATAQKAVGRLGDAVAEVDVEGGRAYAAADALDELTGRSVVRTVRLLPAFDPWVIAATRQPALLVGGEPVRDRVYRSQGWISPVVLVDGMAAGVWRHERTGRAVAVTVEPFAPLTRRVRAAVATEAERLAAHLGAPLHLTWA